MTSFFFSLYQISLFLATQPFCLPIRKSGSTEQACGVIPTKCSKVGTGCPFYRVTRIPPSEPVRAVSSCIRLSTYSWLLQSAVAVSISTTTAVFETSYAVALPPGQVRFHADYSALIPLSVPLKRSAEPITGLHRVIQQLRCHAGMSCLGNPAFSAERRSSVLQVFRSSLFPRKEGLPEELDREAEMQCSSIFWSSVSAIVRWRPQGGQKD